MYNKKSTRQQLAPTMPLILTRAFPPESLQALLPPMLSTFFSPPSPIPCAKALWCRPSPRSLALADARFRAEAATDPTALWLQVVDTDAAPAEFANPRLAGDDRPEAGGRGTEKAGEECMVVGASLWHVYPTWVDAIAAPWGIQADYFEGEERAEAEAVLDALPANVNRAAERFEVDGKKGEPHVSMSTLESVSLSVP